MEKNHCFTFFASIRDTIHINRIIDWSSILVFCLRSLHIRSQLIFYSIVGIEFEFCLYYVYNIDIEKTYCIKICKHFNGLN